MTLKKIYVNLPVKDLAKTRHFWKTLGFSFYEPFSNNQALCLILHDGFLYSMLITHGLFKTFTPNPIADGSTTQVLMCLEVESREQVDRIARIALENGGTRYKDPTEYAGMYSQYFADLDGHHWEILFTNPTPSS